MNYINFIRKTIDGTITDIYLHDDRIKELIASDVTKALVVYNAGTAEAPDYKINTAALNYVPTDADGKLVSDLNAGGYKIINLCNGVNDTDAINKGQLDTAIASLGKILTFKGVVNKFENLPMASEDTIGHVYIVKYDDNDVEINREYVGVKKLEDEEWVYVWEPLGPVIDLTGYLRKDELATSTGSSETTAMTQKATSEAIQAVTTIANSKITNPEQKTNGQVLTYDSTLQAWIAADPAETGVLSITALNQSITVDSTDTHNPKVGVTISSAAGNALQLKTESGQAGLFVQETGASAQSDWEETDPEDPSYIWNKPTLGTASAADVSVNGVHDNDNKLPTDSQVKTYVDENDVYVGNTAPTAADTELWVDTSVDGSGHPVGTVVNSVNGRTGTVVLNKADVNLANVDNTSDNDKPVSSATALQLDRKVDIVTGKNLSTYDFNDTYKNKIDNIRTIATSGLASDVYFNRGTSQLESEDVNAAILELNQLIEDVSVNVSMTKLQDPGADYHNVYILTVDSVPQGERIYVPKVKADNNTIKFNANTQLEVDTDVISTVDTTAYSIALECDTTDYKLKAILKDRNNTVLSISNVIDLPIETFIIDGRYDSQRKTIILTLKNGHTIEFSVADLVSGLATTASVTAEVNRATAAENALGATISAHIGSSNNPHNVTKAQLGLSDVENTSDLNKPISTATQAALDLKQDLIAVSTGLEKDASETIKCVGMEFRNAQSEIQPGAFKVVRCTQDEYNALQNRPSSTFYLIINRIVANLQTVCGTNETRVYILDEDDTEIYNVTGTGQTYNNTFITNIGDVIKVKLSMPGATTYRITINGVVTEEAAAAEQPLIVTTTVGTSLTIKAEAI